MLGFSGRDRRRWFIKEQDSTLQRERLGNLYQLGLRDAEPGNFHHWIKRKVESVQPVQGFLLERSGVHDPQSRGQALKQYILRNREARDQVPFLMHSANACFECSAWRGQMQLGPIEKQPSLIRTVQTRNDFDQG